MTDTELNAKILRLHKAGKNPVQISEELGTHSRAAVESRLRRQGIKPNRVPRGTISTQGDVQDRQKIVDLVERALQQERISPDEVKKLSGVRVSKWQVVTKDLDGEPHVTDLEGHKVKIELTPAWADGPEWPVVQPATPVNIKPVKVTGVKRGEKVAVIPPDPQIGFWRDIETGELVSFHDERAMDICLQIIRDVQPDVVVNLGDFLDFAEFGKFEQEPTFQMTTQAALNRGHQFLAEQRANAPNAEIVVIEGNHDRRLQKAIVRNAAAAFGLKRASLPESWPVLSVPHLLRLDDLNVKYVAGYPAAAYWLNDRLKCMHGRLVRGKTNVAKAILEEERVSVITGHTHRIELLYRTFDYKNGGRTNFAFAMGCLCKTDGTVPSFKGSTDLMGRPVPTSENWQQGVGVVTYTEDGEVQSPEYAHIENGQALFRGKLYSTNTSETG